jgi:oligoendopeptidase F
MAVQPVPTRDQVAEADTWDLTPLFENDEQWQASLHRLEEMAAGFEKFRGRLGESAGVLRECCDFEMEFYQLAERLGSYAFLKSSENVSDSTYQGMYQRFIHAATQAEEAASYIAPEIQAIPEDRMQQFLASPELAEYRFMLEKLLRYRPHILSEKEERILAMQGEVGGSARRIFGQLNDADLQFGMVEDDEGEEVELTQASFRSLLESRARAVREKAFHQFYGEYQSHENTLAATLSSSVLQDVYVARVRNYDSALEAGLFADKVPIAVYDSLIKAVHANLDTVYHYFDVRRKALELDDIHFYDTYVPIVEQGKYDMPFDDAVDQICESLQPLGAQYVDALARGLRHGRWVDRYENKGKRSGAFSAGGYTGPPYILMNYRPDLIDSVFTLAHEAGHSMHTYMSASTQPFQYYDYTIFVAEVASTFNEQLLNKHLLEQSEDDKTRAFLINKEIDEIRGTIVRQTMFAEYEKVIHALAEEGEPLTVDVLREEYRKLLGAYFGPDFVVDEALSLEGMRIPHFYGAFYVYKYATGLAAAIALSERVMEGGDAEREQYLSFLKAGSSKYPLDILRDAGVDMEQPEPVDRAMARMKELVAELEELV